MNKRNLLVVSALALSIAVVALMAGATPALAVDTTPDWSNYTACANDGGGNPITGTRDMYFLYYNQSTDGDKKWEEYHNDVEISDCYFAVKLGSQGSPLDYEDYAGPRYLEVRICDDNDCPSDGSGAKYKTLPRQELGAAPWAYRAQYFSGYQYHIVVAKSGGDYTSVYDAVESITDASADKPYVIWVGPGIYVEDQVIDPDPYIYIMGMGYHATYIRNSDDDRTFYLGSNTGLYDLTVQNRYQGDNSYAIYVKSGATNVNLHYVGAYADYDSNNQKNHYAYYASGPGTEAHVYYGYFYAKYGQYNYGVYNIDGAKTYLKGGEYYGYEGEYAYGVYNEGSTSNKSYVDIYYVHAYGQKAEKRNYGLYNSKNAEAKLNKGYYRGYYDVSNGVLNDHNCYGIYNQWGTVNAYYAYAYGEGCYNYNYGIYNYYKTGEGYDAYKSTSYLDYGYYAGYNYGGGVNGGVGDYCYGIYNEGSGDNAYVTTNYAGGYAKYCTKENWGGYNKYGWLTSYGGTYYGYDNEEYDSSQECGGVYNIGSSGASKEDYNGVYKGYDVTAYGKYCYYNYGLWNGEYGYAGVYGGTYYAQGESGSSKGEYNYALYNKGDTGKYGYLHAAQCVAYSSGADTDNYGSYGSEYGYTYIDSCTIKGDTNQAVYVKDNAKAYVGASKVEGKEGEANSGTIKCVYTYDEDYNPLNCTTP